MNLRLLGMRQFTLGFAGTIPDALSSLAALNKLNLNFNRFDGLSIHFIPKPIAVLLSNGCQVSLYANKSFQAEFAALPVVRNSELLQSPGAE